MLRIFFSIHILFSTCLQTIYSITERVEILSLIFVPPAEGGGMEISMKHMKFIKTAGIIVLIFVVIVILLSIVILALTHN